MINEQGKLEENQEIIYGELTLPEKSDEQGKKKRQSNKIK